MIDRFWGDDGTVNYDCSGKIGLEDLMRALTETVTDGRYAQTHASIWDMRGSTIGFGMEAHNQAAATFLAILGRPKNTRRTAWVVNYKISEAIIETYYKAFDWPQEWRCFQNIDEAKRWVLE